MNSLVFPEQALRGWHDKLNFWKRALHGARFCWEEKMATSSTPEVLRFGLFELDMRARQLRRQGRLVRLQQQPFQLLLLLIAKPQELITRDEIRQKLWPEDTFVEFDDSVNHAIRKLRDALRDDAENPRFIETVPRQGYRFIAPVQAVPIITLENAPTAPASNVRKLRWPIATLCTVAVIASLFWRFQPHSPSIRSIAVLPLQNLSGDPSQDYFSEGMTEAIITELGQNKGVRIISHHSVMQFKTGDKPLPQIAKELGVDALVEGGLVRHGDHVRITAQLVAAHPERHLWASSYEGDAGDLITLQREIAADISQQIRTSLLWSNSSVIKPSRIDPRGYELYLRGREHLNMFDFPTARDYLEQAAILAPNYALVHASLGIVYTQLGFLTEMPRDEAAARARTATSRALALDGKNAEAHTAIAYAEFFFDWDFQAPDQHFQRAIELNPNSSDAHLLYSVYLTLCGRFDDAILQNRLAISIDPLNPAANFNLGWIYGMAKRSQEGIDHMEQLRRRDSEYPELHHHMGWLYAEIGKCPEALAETKGHESLDSAYVFAVCGKKQMALDLLRKAELGVSQGNVDPIYPAWINAVLGRHDEAFRWLNVSIDTRSTQVVFIKVMPELDSLRSDPRFAAVLHRAGIT